MERALIGEFEASVAGILANLSEENLEEATKVVRLYMDIRGYGPVQGTGCKRCSREDRQLCDHACVSIAYEFDLRPDSGEVNKVADGIEWLRMPLPFALSHINLWMLRDEGRIAIVDTGISSKKSQEIWRSAIADRPVSRVLVTHLHPDHVGSAGWLCEEHGVELWMTREEYLLCRVLVADTGREAPGAGVRFYRAAGFPDDAIQRYQDRFGSFGKVVAPLPESYRRLQDGDNVSIDGSTWQVIVGRGHSPEHGCLLNTEKNVLISGDQLLPRISSNVSVHPTEPFANPLLEWLDSLADLKDRISTRRTGAPGTRQPISRCTRTTWMH